MPIGATVRRDGQARATMNATPTVQTVCSGLADPISYVRRVLENMWPSGRDSIVRLSIASTTGAPDYLVEEIMLDDVGNPIGSVQIQAFSGKTHRPLNLDRLEDWRRWARSSMSRGEVQNLLGALRGFEAKKTKR